MSAIDDNDIRQQETSDRPVLTLTQVSRRTQQAELNKNQKPSLTLALTAEERTRTRFRHEPDTGPIYLLRLPRGTVVQPGDYLRGDGDNTLVMIEAKSEPVLTVTAHQSFELLRAAYHLGNRHVALEIAPTYLRLSPDPVLRSLLEQLGLQVQAELQPFQPEPGAYHHHHASS